MADDNSYTKSKTEKKVYEVIKASRKDFTGIIGQGKEMRFGKQGAFTTSDPKLAKEINEKYGYAGGSRDVVVVERPHHDQSRLHSVPAMPWHEEDE